MKEKLTLFLALSFVIGLTLYKGAIEDNTYNENPIKEQLTSNTEINSSSGELKEKLIYTESENSRAQDYIDKNWAADKTLNEAAYRVLGGKYTGYWDNKNIVVEKKVDTKSTNNNNSISSLKVKSDLVDNIIK